MFSLHYLAALVGFAAAAQVTVIGSDRSLDLSAPSNQAFSHIVHQPDATYIAPHFDFLNLPPGGILEITSLDGSQKVSYTGAGRTNFYTEYITGDAAVISYFPPESLDVIGDDDNASAPVAFKLDRFASGYPNGSPADAIEAICGNDDTKALVCVKNTDAAKYKKAQAVARLFIGGSSLCTGWLFGSEGHLITNNHCIGDAATASNIQFEFGAECKTCDDPNNTKQLGCPGETVATSATFVHTSKDFDYTLVKLNVKSGVDLSKYGYLQARASGPVLNEPIYIAQHPAGKPTRIATVLDNGSVGTIESFSINTCSNDEVGYTLDTEGGSSGSPVLSVNDNVVVALHNCGGCLNGAIKIDKVVAELKSLGFLPANAIVGSTPPGTTPSPPVTTPSPPVTTPKSTVAPKTTTPAPKTTTKKPTPAPKTTKPLNGCDTCDYCYYPNGNSCLSSFDQSDCDYYAANYGTIWCGN
ncbi:Aste57867_8621 [Aphanomyces stellatus]|uniref:Aste57867_8621 protein n=1 Tax=Aphanomyces stellatus TaxID=120398 RepID=A0A485KKY2_9STRA|nr:hypothetical protein As57867_008587 [Aphanomyces stellatus]VFT85507.1 Aste57867_8621 [Aphanomyces stellatus]